MDTNDAQSFLLVAAHQIDLRPAVARDAFWWATKLDPGSAPAYYGLRMATILADESVVRLLINGAKNERDREDMRRLDSLDLKVELLDPFASRNLEGKLYKVLVAHTNLIKPREIKVLGAELRLN